MSQDLMELKLTDHVKEIHYNYEGYINEIYDNFYAIEFLPHTNPRKWLDNQVIEFTPTQINHEQWFSVRCFQGGDILCPESCLRLMEANPVNPVELFNT